MLQNIASMVVTFSVCHSPMGWLNDFASENIYSMLTTLRTSQSPIGSLNSLNCSSLNNSLISVILDTSHEFGGPHWTSVSSWFVSHPTNILCNTNLDWGCTLVIPSARHSKGLFQKIPKVERTPAAHFSMVKHPKHGCDVLRSPLCNGLVERFRIAKHVFHGCDVLRPPLSNGLVERFRVGEHIVHGCDVLRLPLSSSFLFFFFFNESSSTQKHDSLFLPTLLKR